MMDVALTIAGVPCGHGEELVAVVCEDEKLPFFRHAFQAALGIVDVPHYNVWTEEGSFKRRRSLFPRELVEALETLVGERTQFFDIISVTHGPWAGLQAVGLGSNGERRRQAGKIALAIAALHDDRSVAVKVARTAIESFGRCINRTLTPWKPEIHRHWDLGSRRKVQVLLLCQKRQSQGGLIVTKELLITIILPYMMMPRFLSGSAARDRASVTASGEHQ